MRRAALLALLLVGLSVGPLTATANAQPDPTFGMEFEFAGAGNRIVSFEEMPFENYERILNEVRAYYGGRGTIKKVEFQKETSNLERYPEGVRTLFRAEYKDPRGRTWLLEPEFVASTGYDGYELVTPPMDDTNELREILTRVRGSGHVREGRRSGVHLTIDGKTLIKRNGDARALANLIIMHENYSPMLRRMFNPVRGGGHANYFARSLARDHPDLLRDLNALPANKRTRANLEALFLEHEGREARLHNADPMDPTSWKKAWKYRELNLAKMLNVNEIHDGNSKLVEFRMFDMADPETHRLEAEFYRRLVAKARSLADAGVDVEYTRPRRRMSDDPAITDTPNDPNEARAKAREMVEFVGLDPAEFNPLMERTIRAREHYTEREFRGLLDGLPTGRVEHNGKAFTYGFELEGRGSGFVNIAVPTNPTVARRWARMSEEAKKAYFDEVTGGDPKTVDKHFKPDLKRYPWIDPDWKVENTGNWEIRSTVHENLSEATERMRLVRDLAGKDALGFHLHMRDNNPNWEKLNPRGSEFADWLSRSGDWVYLKRVERLRTDLSLKSWSNARMAPNDVELASEFAPTLHSAVRISHLESGGQNDFIDLEIRGFSRYVDDIETLAKIWTHGLKHERFGPWKHTDNLMESASLGTPEGLELTRHVNEYVKTVDGSEMTPERRAILEGLNELWVKKAGKDIRAYPSGIATPMLSWGDETAMTEAERRDARFMREEYLGWLARYTKRIQDGEFGFDVNLASEEALKELGLSANEARALVAYRRANGDALNVADATRAIALRAGTNADMSKLAKLDNANLELANAAALRARLGLTAAESRNLTNLRDPHSVEEAMRLAGLNANARRGILGAAETLDLGDTRTTVNAIVERTGLSEDVARRILAFRGAHDVSGESALREAGLNAAETSDALGRVGTGTDISSMSASELASTLGISAEDAEALVEARTSRRFRSFNELVTKVGLTEAARDRVRSAVRTLDALNTMDVDAIAEKAKLTEGQWSKLITYRDASDVNSLETLREVLGTSAGNKAFKLVNGLDLNTATYEELRALGIKPNPARLIVDHRDVHDIGRDGLSSFDADAAARELARAKIITADEAWNLAIDAERAEIEYLDVEDLRSERFGLTKAEAERFIAMRDANALDLEGLKRAGLTAAKARKILAEATPIDPRTASVEAIMSRTGLTRAKATKLKELAKVDFKKATVEELVEAGFGNDRAERLVAFREGAAELEGMDYAGVVRNLRLKVRAVVRNSGLSDAMLRSLLPRGDVSVARNVEGPGENFSSVRRGAPGEFRPSRISYDLVGSVFASIREAGISRNGERMAEATTPAEKANLEAARGIVEGLELKIVESNDILAERSGKEIRVSTGLLNEIETRVDAQPAGKRPHFRARVLGLILGHETAHASGLKSEKLADAESIKLVTGGRGLGDIHGVEVPVEATEIRQAVDAFARPTGASHVDNFFSRVRNMLRYGTTGRRVNDLERAARGEEIDSLARFRRADGTLDWKAMGRAGALKEGLGTAHFALALFLKELAVVVQTGDRVRIEEFFDGLMTTEFYTHYGMFVIGARAGEVAYVRYLQRYIKPRFVNGILKSNLVLAAGLALPEIINGTFTGKAFAISLTSLGLSSAAVKSGIAGIKWVVDLKKAKQTGTLARTGMAAGRLAKFGGWFYTAAELAVILYFAEDIDKGINKYLDRRAARNALSAASTEFFNAVGDPGASAESVAEASRDYHDAWTNYRDFLYTPMYAEEAIFADRLETAAREAKIAADKRTAAVDRIASRASLRASIESRYGSLENYAKHLTDEEDKKLAAEVGKYATSYNTNRERLLEEIYEDNRRGTGLLDGVDNLDWLVLGGREGAENDPYSAGTVWGRLGRGRAHSGLEDAIEEVSLNRLETYDDEAAVLEATETALRNAGHGERADALSETRRIVALLHQADERLSRGETGVFNVGDAAGAAETVDELLNETDEPGEDD